MPSAHAGPVLRPGGGRASGGGEEDHIPPPEHKFLADTVWPITQNHLDAQASSSFPSLVSSEAVVDEVLDPLRISDPIALLYTPDNAVVWGSSWTHIFKIDRRNDKLKVIALYAKPDSIRMSGREHGSYAFLDVTDTYYFSGAGTVIALGNEVEGDHLSGIRHKADWSMPDRLPDENIIAVSLAYDGTLIFATNKGRLGALCREPLELIDFVSLADDRVLPEGSPLREELVANPDLDVTNSISIGDDNGVFVASNRYLHKVQWNEDSQRFDRSGWVSRYDVAPELQGRLSGQGSGSTPSIMRTPTGNFVVITDGAKLMKLVVFDASTGAMVAATPVTFGDPDAEASSSDQSVLVSGNRMVVVNNLTTRKGERINRFEPMTSAIAMALSLIPETVQENTDLLPVLLGDSPCGVEQFELNEEANPPTLLRTWVRTDVCIPNGIPTMGRKSNVMYGVGKRGFSGGTPRVLKGQWTIEGLDWTTGRQILTVPLGSDVLYNSFYAATEIGADGEIITGTLGGVVRVRPKFSSSILRQSVVGQQRGGPPGRSSWVSAMLQSVSFVFGDSP